MRYFKATDGVITVFRSSATRVYVSASFTRYDGETRPSGDIGFSAKPGKFPTTEITHSEFVELTAAKVKRMKADGCPTWMTGPQQSWVRNEALN